MVPGAIRTQVGIIGAGPAGLLLARLLALQGIESVIVENRSRAYVEARIRAGVLEQGTVDLLKQAGVADRLAREGLRHDGIYLQWPGRRHRIDFPALCGRSVWVYGQTEVVKDLLQARLSEGLPVWFEVSGTAVDHLDSDRPRLTFTDRDGVPRLLECDWIAGCDGFHGVSRASIPGRPASTGRAYPYAWLGILAEVAPSTDELIYAWHPDGFALHSMRSPTLSRLYVQVDLGERIEEWPDERIWAALATRLAEPGWTLHEGPVREKGITPMRSFVSLQMRYGRLFLAGDAAHIVPPTGAKGLNLALADVRLLAEAFVAGAAGDHRLLDAYQDTALRRVWRSTHFSGWMTALLHNPPHSATAAFERQLQLAELDYLTRSPAAAEVLAENYTGLPFGG